MSNIDWGILQTSAADQAQQQQANALQRENLQQNRGLNALRGINLNDPNSVQNGVNALTGLGLADQASALTNLAQTRFQNQTFNPILSAGAKQGLESLDRGQSSDQQQPDLDAAHKQILQDGADAVSSVLEQTDPALRAAAAATARHQLEAKYPTIPKENFDEIFGDLSDQGLQQHQAYLQSVANGEDAEHPTGHAASRSVFDANNPGGDQARQILSGALMNPVVQGVFEKAGIPLSSGINQAIAVTGPARSAAASAPYTPVTVEGPQGQQESMSAANFASGQAQPDAQAIQGATPYAKSAQTAAAGAPYQTVTTTGPQGQSQTESAAQFAAGRGAPETPGGPPGPINAAPITGPTAAGGQKLVAAGQQYSGDLQAAAASQPAQVALRKVVDTLPTTPIGPGTQAVNNWRSFVLSQLPVLAPLIPGGVTQAQVQTAKVNELQKYMVQIAGAGAAQYGAGTNEKLAFATSGNPHISMDNLSALDVSRMNLALQRAQNAKPYLFSTTKEDPGQYSDFASNYARTVDPRAFMLDLLSIPERDKLLSTITTPSDRAKFQRGVQAAEAAGYFTRADLPR